MAARETGIGAVETFMHAGKLLALDLLVKVLEHQGHTWSHVRQEVRLVDLGKNVQIFLLFHCYFSKPSPVVSRLSVVFYRMSVICRYVISTTRMSLPLLVETPFLGPQK